jgi:N utilization substance protein B
MRHLAREFAVQALYQWELNRDLAINIELEFNENPDLEKADKKYFSEILYGVIPNITKLYNYIASVADRSLSELDPVEHSILRIAVYEFLFQPGVPYKVVINEALNLTKKYGGSDGYKYVNGVLDKLAKELRSVERSGKFGSTS